MNCLNSCEITFCLRAKTRTKFDKLVIGYLVVKADDAALGGIFVCLIGGIS